MAPVSKGKENLGLDIGQDAVKAVSLIRKGGEVVYSRRAVLQTREEGILDETELYSSVSQWLDDLGLDAKPMTLGLPQYLATTQLSDFPGGAAGELDEMVAFETRQLAGLSEESFLSDYQVLSPNFGRKNPVLIGICRESVINERCDALAEAGLAPSDLTMTGTAAVNTFFHLHPEALLENEPQMVLDLGAETSTMTVVAAGQVLFIGSLMFGAGRYTKALMQAEDLTETDAEARKRTAKLNQADPADPLLAVTRRLESELRTAVDHWRSSERDEIGQNMFAGIWLCGGGAQLDGLSDYFQRTYGCPARTFGPPSPDDGTPEPALATAFGLALHGIGEGWVTISLAPETLIWEQQRLNRFGYLVCASLFAAALLALILYRRYEALVNEKQLMENDLQQLRQCEKLIPKIEEFEAAVYHHELMMVPFVELGNRAKKTLLTMDALAAARGEKDWFIYLADEFSYAEGKATDEEDADDDDEDTAAGPGLIPVLPTAGFTPGNSRDDGLPQYMKAAIPVAEMPRLHAMIAYGFTPLRTRRYETVRELTDKLNDHGAFAGVDLLPNTERIGREATLVSPWLRYFETEPMKGRFLQFPIRLPFAQHEVSPDLGKKKED